MRGVANVEYRCAIDESPQPVARGFDFDPERLAGRVAFRVFPYDRDHAADALHETPVRARGTEGEAVMILFVEIAEDDADLPFRIGTDIGGHAVGAPGRIADQGVRARQLRLIATTDPRHLDHS